MKIKNITLSDIKEMLTFSKPDEVYSFIMNNLKHKPNKAQTLWLRDTIKPILSK